MPLKMYVWGFSCLSALLPVISTYAVRWFSFCCFSIFYDFGFNFIVKISKTQLRGANPGPVGNATWYTVYTPYYLSRIRKILNSDKGLSPKNCGPLYDPPGLISTLQFWHGGYLMIDAFWDCRWVNTTRRAEGLFFAYFQGQRNPATKHIIPEDLKPSANRCENVKIRRLRVFLKIHRKNNDYFPE